MACFGNGLAVISNQLELTPRAVSGTGTASLTGSLVGASTGAVLAVDASPNSITVTNADANLTLRGMFTVVMAIDALTTAGATTTGAIENGLNSADIWYPGVSTGGSPTSTYYVRMPALRSVGTYGEAFLMTQTIPLVYDIAPSTTATFNYRAGIASPFAGNHYWNLSVLMTFIGAHL